jgi:hypothetical protein
MDKIKKETREQVRGMNRGNFYWGLRFIVFIGFLVFAVETTELG